MKECPNCGPLPDTDFDRCKGRKDGLQRLCRSCHRERFRGDRVRRNGLPQPHKDWLKEQIGE